MESGNSIYIFPIFVNSGTSLQNSKGESQCSNTNQSTMVNLTLVSKSSCNVIFSTFATPNVLSRSEELKIGRPSLGNKQIISTSDLEGYRETLIKLEILERVVDVIVRDKDHQLITTLPVKYGLAGVIRNKLIHFDAQ